MNVTLRHAGMIREQFFSWVDVQDERYEFDGVRPVLVTGGNNNHSLIDQNLYFALRSRLQGSGWLVLGPDAGLNTVENAVRYPDGMVTRAKYSGTDRVVPGVVVVFEVPSQASGGMDRIIKLREYRAISTILRYVILESASAGQPRSLVEMVRRIGLRFHYWLRTRLICLSLAFSSRFLSFT